MLLNRFVRQPFGFLQLIDLLGTLGRQLVSPGSARAQRLHLRLAFGGQLQLRVMRLGQSRPVLHQRLHLRLALGRQAQRSLPVLAQGAVRVGRCSQCLLLAVQLFQQAGCLR